MQKDLRRLMLNGKLLPSKKRDLLSKIAIQAASMGIPCYLVGGFVRDLLLERPVNDFDIVVVGDAIKFGDVLVGKLGGKLTTHKKFRTSIWNLNKNDSLDLITARSELYVHPGALPTIKPSTIEADLLRRDFTINAMALRLDGEHFGEMIDPLNGQKDLEQGLIRVLHPHSFIDDPTRIFRAVRYEGRYGFNLDFSTFSLVNSEALEVLKTLSGERIRHELDLIFEEERPARMLIRLNELGIFNILQPELSNLISRVDTLFNSIPSDELGVLLDRVSMGWLLWLMDLPQDATKSLSKRLDFTSGLTAAVLAVSQLKTDLPTLAGSKPSAWTARLEKFPPLSIYVVWLASKEPALKEFLVHWQYVKTNITGDDLKARGIQPGPRYKEILSRLRSAWLDGEIRNENQEKELLKTLL